MAEGNAIQQFEKLPLGGKVLVLVLLLAVVSGGYYFIFHMGVSDDLDAATGRHAQLTSELEGAQQREQQFLRLSQELTSREASDRQNKRVLPEDPEIPAFLQDLNRLAEVAGLRIDRVEPRPEEPEEQYTRIPVQLTLKGRFHQVAKFFFSVTTLRRVINMENVRLSGPRIEGEGVSLDIAVMATTFRRPRPAAAAGGGAT